MLRQTARGLAPNRLSIRKQICDSHQGWNASSGLMRGNLQMSDSTMTFSCLVVFDSPGARSRSAACRPPATPPQARACLYSEATARSAGCREMKWTALSFFKFLQLATVVLNLQRTVWQLSLWLFLGTSKIGSLKKIDHEKLLFFSAKFWDHGKQKMIERALVLKLNTVVCK